MRTLRILFSLVLLAASLFGCQSPPAPALSAADQQAIRQTEDQSLKIANTSADWIAYTKLYYAGDAIFNPPNAPSTKGQDAIVAFFKSLPPISNFRTNILELDGWGNTAYVYGTYSLTMTVPGGKPESDRGKYVEIWKRQPDGTWKVAIDTFNSDLPLPGPEQKK
jgi:ketosteroid isomerase-like protein